MKAAWIIGLALAGGANTAAAQQIGVPRSVEAVAVSPTEIRLYWLAAPNATGYQIQRDGKPLITLPAGATEYDDKDLAPDSTHRYAVQVVQDQQTSSPIFYTERSFAPFPSAESRRSLSVVSFDVVVVQASSGGVAAAIEAARRGLRVALIEPTTRLGGMPVNGLSATDLRRPQHISGFMARFRDRVQALHAREGVKTNGLQYEPRIAHQAMKSLLYEVPNLAIYRRARLARVLSRPSASEIADAGDLNTIAAVSPNFARNSTLFDEKRREQSARRRVDAVVVEELGADGQPTGRRAEFRAKVFIDATDCGDLAAWAGAPFGLGREARTSQEPHNGVIYYDRAGDKALPGSTGEADRRIQSYAYLFVVKDYGKGADKTIPKPPGYRREDFIHTPAWEKSWAVTSGKLPGDKYELNQHPQGGDYQGINYDYPTGDYRERARVERLYRDRVLGYLYYIQTEQGQKQIGIPDDEYRDTGGFPPLLYVREGRRIVGEQLPVEADITNGRRIVRPESVGIGDYPMDSHAVRPKTDWTTPDMGEGEWWLYQYTPVHSLPLGILVPRNLDNVFVTTAVSSTHVSFGTYRLEPVRMAFGQAAGIAASLCIRYNLTAREVPARQIQDDLLPHPANPQGDPNAFLYFFNDLKPGSHDFRVIQYLAARGFLPPNMAYKPDGDDFKPDAPTTRAEFQSWLALLLQRAARANSSAGSGDLRAYFPYMGYAAKTDALHALQSRPADATPLRRDEMAAWLLDTGLLKGHTRPDAPTYVDTQENAPAQLAAYGIDSRLWDDEKAFAPNDRLYFRPDMPLSHADVFLALYLLNRSLGPLFFDNPVDGRNGREVLP